MNQFILNRLTYQPDALDHLLLGLSEEQIRQRPQPEKCSIFENLAHLGRYQEIFSNRLQQIINTETPLFSRYVADTDPGFMDWTGLSFQELVERLTLNAFISILTEEQLTNLGLHPAYGPMTITGWTEFFPLHEAHHFFTILKLGGALRKLEQPMGL